MVREHLLLTLVIFAVGIASGAIGTVAFIWLAVMNVHQQHDEEEATEGEPIPEPESWRRVETGDGSGA